MNHYLGMNVCICLCVVQQKREAALKEGWEYARLAHLTYHITRHPLDFARRRRYLRKLTGDPRRPAIFHFKGKERKVRPPRTPFDSRCRILTLF